MYGKIQRILGSFPIFGSKLDQKELRTITDKWVHGSSPYAVYDSDRVAYEEGAESFTAKSLNGLLKFITTGISYLYQHGVPEFSISMKYPEGAVVSFKGDLYISTTDNNTKHPTNEFFWKRVATIDLNRPVGGIDNNPIGTILTVPVGTEIDGYIDFEDGKEFSDVIYPDLYRVLGSTRFNAPTGDNANTDELPVGAMVYTLSDETPYGWIEFKANASIAGYSELKRVLQRMISKLPLGDVRTVWTEALNANVLPDLDGNDFYLRNAQSGLPNGMYHTDVTNVPDFGMLPVVVDDSNTLSPMGLTRQSNNELRSPIVGAPYQESSQFSDVVLIAHKSEDHSTVEDTRIINTSLGSAGTHETAPKSLPARLLIKAKALSNRNHMGSHKHIIKAF